MKRDILIVYEHRKREIENACLLAVELEERGYSVEIRHVESLIKYFVEAKVVIAPHLYNDYHIIVIAKNLYLSHRNLISLQYEQVLSSSSTNAQDNIHDPKGEAIHAQHIAWGKAQEKRYLSHGIRPDNVHVTGHLAMDLMRSVFDDYFLTKKDLASLYGLKENKTWVLFMSSFSYANRTEKEIEAYSKLNPYASQFARISDESRFEILRWLSEACQLFPEKEFIYRPHPAEEVTKDILKLVNQHPNFHCIGDCSVRQWVRASDTLYNWYSTSIADAYFANKSCQILRPIPIPKEIDIDLMCEMDKVETYEMFIHSLDEKGNNCTDISNEIAFYYGEKDSQFAYIQIADLCEKMMVDNLGYQYTYGNSRWNILNQRTFIEVVKTYLWHFACDCARLIRLSGLLPDGSLKQTLARFELECFHIAREIRSIKRRLRPIIATNNKKQ